MKYGYGTDVKIYTHSEEMQQVCVQLSAHTASKLTCFLLNIQAFWNFTLCQIVKQLQTFQRIILQSTRPRKPEDENPYGRRRFI